MKKIRREHPLDPKDRELFLLHCRDQIKQDLTPSEIRRAIGMVESGVVGKQILLWQLRVLRSLKSMLNMLKGEPWDPPDRKERHLSNVIRTRNTLHSILASAQVSHRDESAYKE